MTDESRPEEKQSADAQPVQADPSLQDTGQPQQAAQDTGQAWVTATCSKSTSPTVPPGVYLFLDKSCDSSAP
jgi:hypothetical protein